MRAESRANRKSRKDVSFLLADDTEVTPMEARIEMPSKHLILLTSARSKKLGGTWVRAPVAKDEDYFPGT